MFCGENRALNPGEGKKMEKPEVSAI